MSSILFYWSEVKSIESLGGSGWETKRETCCVLEFSQRTQNSVRPQLFSMTSLVGSRVSMTLLF